MLLAFFLLFTLFIIIIVYVYANYSRLYQLARQFPGPPVWPIIGNAYLFIGAAPETLIQKTSEITEKYGNTFRFWLGSQLNIFTSNVQNIEAVLSSSKLITKSDEYKYFSIWLHDGLLLSKGHKWFQRRKLITPAFHFKILEKFLITFQEKSLLMVKELQLISAENIELHKFISLCTLDIICETAMGVSVNAQTNANSEYVKAVKTISKVIHKRMADWRYHFNFIYNFTKMARDGKKALAILHGFTEKIIIQRRKELLKSQKNGVGVNSNTNKDDEDVGAKRKMAFLDILLQSEIDGKPLSNLDIREEVDTFMFEGHDTTTSALTFFFYNIAKYPECQRKCFEEIASIMGKDKSLTYENHGKLRYVELCIKESLRLFPPVAIIGRKVTEECEVNGKLIPPGANIGISPLHLGRQEEIFNEPNAFKPERFDVITSADKINPYAYIPFSAGPRNCIGQKFAMLEIKSIVTNVLRHFEIEYIGNPNEEPILIAELILGSKDPLMFKLKSRIY